MNLEQLHSLFLEFPSVCTDTRKLKENDIFFALKGPNFDGNLFAQQAVLDGASYAIVDEKTCAQDNKCILVDDVLETLQQLANFHRKYLNLKIIAITGSNGKTTTKELVSSVLSKNYETVATKGNFNNHIGVPLTLLSMNENTDIGIVEMGANHLKEIEFLCSIAEPDYGYITNFGKAHLEGFGSIEGVIKGKTELYSFLTHNGKLVFLNTDDEIQLRGIKSYNKRFGYGSNGDLKIDFLNANPTVRLNFKDLVVNSNLIGSYNYDNIAAAITIGTYFNIEANLIKEAIEDYVPNNNRSQIITTGDNTIILDAYNANPTSIIAAIDHFADLKANNKVAILGDMFELGNKEIEEHNAIAKYTLEKVNGDILLVGENFSKEKISANDVNYFESFEQLVDYINIKSYTNTTFLIKASRGMALERLIDYL